MDQCRSLENAWISCKTNITTHIMTNFRNRNEIKVEVRNMQHIYQCYFRRKFHYAFVNNVYFATIRNSDAIIMTIHFMIWLKHSQVMTNVVGGSTIHYPWCTKTRKEAYVICHKSIAKNERSISYGLVYWRSLLFSK